MPPALAVHIGVDVCAPAHYVIAPSPLRSAERDAAALSALTTARGLDAITLCGADATRTRVLDVLADAVTLPAGALLVLTFSGHGVQLADRAADPARPRPPSARHRTIGDEADGRDEAWCLHDGFLLDDELTATLAALAPGVRLLVLSDSCHSGTMLDGAPAIAASGILLAACPDERITVERGDHGAFTGAVLAVWDEGRFAGDHPAFHDAVCANLGAQQAPQLAVIGAHDPSFLAQTPFTP